MISFKEYLIEIFGGDFFPWTVVNNNDPLLVKFTVDKQEYLIAINQHTSYDSKSVYMISFGRDNVPASSTGVLVKKYDLKTALKVYNTVINVLRVKIAPYMKSGDEIYFSPYDNRTKKVYGKFADMIAKEIGGKITSSGWGGDFTVMKK